MTRNLSKPKRWMAAAAAARDCLDKLIEAQQDLQIALSELGDIQSEYQERYDNLSELSQDGPVGEKLQEVCDINFDIEIDLGEYEDIIECAENAELP